MIVFPCFSCQKKLSVKDELAGKKVKCPGCGNAVVVPQAVTAISPGADAHRLASRIEPDQTAPAGERTLPPADRSQATHESLAGSSEQTGAGEATQGMPGDGHDPDLWSFLAPAEQPDEIGRLGGYRILKVLGRGGMGVVFRAEDPGLQRLVALKAMLPALANSRSAKERFVREARAAAGLKHPHVVTIHQVGEDRGAPFLAMEFLEGEPLDDRLKRELRLPVADILRIGREIAHGLAAAHAKGLIHRDIKPANIWLEASPGCKSGEFTVKILDFGLARAMGDQTHLTQSGAIVGTPAYMAPEQAGGKQVDHRCDLFSLGCVLYRMCTGEMPFKGNDTISLLSALALETPPPPATLNAEVPAELSDLVMQLLAKKPEERPASAQEVVKALQSIDGQSTAIARRPASKSRKPIGGGTLLMEAAPTQPARSPKKRLPRVWLIGGGVVGIGLVALLLFFLFASRERDRPPDGLQSGPLVAKSPPGHFALEFSGKGDYVDIPTLSYTASQPVTLEAWVTAHRADDNTLVLKLNGKTGFSLHQVAGVWGANRLWGDQHEYVHGAKVIPGARVHLAVVWDGVRQHLFVAGKRMGKLQSAPIKMPQPNEGALLGARRTLNSAVPDMLFAGRIDGVRVSKSARYDKDFTPANRFEHDADTLAVYRFDEGQGDKLTDSSGNNHHGKIVGAKWVKADETPISSGAGKFTNALGMEFALVPKGKAWLGGGGGKPGDKEVEFKDDFYLGVYEVTHEEWEKVTGQTPSYFSRKGPGKDAVKDIPDADLKRFPVEEVSWEDTQLFLAELNKREREVGWLYRLPKEVEWEYACRGGPVANRFDSAFDYYFEKPARELLPEQANFDHAKGLKRTCKVGSYKPNRLGLFDMHGNVAEWCEDEERAENGAPLRIDRGGCWVFNPDQCRAAERHLLAPSFRSRLLSLRVARVPVGKEIVKIAPEDKKVPPAMQGKPGPKFTNTLGMEFVLVPKGKSWLGGGGSKPGDKEVEFNDDFYLGVYEVTQEEWQKIMGKNPSHFSRGNAGKDAVKDIADADLKRFPVEMTSWDDTQLFLAELNKRDKATGWTYRLPTQAEWEYACRGGPVADKLDGSFDFYFAKPKNRLRIGQANFDHGQGLNRSCKVGSYEPNVLGLHDMHGNVAEWCDDAYQAPGDIPARMHRGGSWTGGSGHLRASYAPWRPPADRLHYHGLRVARVRVAAEEALEPFVPLFNGKDLSRWRMGKKALDGETATANKQFSVEDGAIVVEGGGGIRDIHTVKDFGTDFHLKLEFRAAPKADSGLYIRGPQLQVRDYLTVGPYKSAKFNKGDWNELDIIVTGAKALCKCNGEVIEKEFKVPATGPIGLQSENGKVEFRRIRIKVWDLTKTDQPKNLPKFTNTLGMDFALVPKGKSWLGGGGGKPGDKEVEFKDDFYLGVYEVTQEQWQKVTGANPSHFSRTGPASPAVKDVDQAELKKFPVDGVSWDGAQVFLKALNELDKKSGWVYRLPTEAEWEYACRGGPALAQFDSSFHFYLEKPSNMLLPEQANFGHGQKLKRPCKVGSYQPNRLGLYDMHGNVQEWCEDEVKDNKGASLRVPRGGCWQNPSIEAQAANRFTLTPSFANATLGLRVVRVPVGANP